MQEHHAAIALHYLWVDTRRIPLREAFNGILKRISHLPPGTQTAVSAPPAWTPWR
jgi:hypothetical protein